MRHTIIAPPLPSIPWQEPPTPGAHIWRYTENPIIPRDAIPSSNSVFNSAVVPFGGAYAGVFRCDDKARRMNIFAGFSDDGIRWRINERPIEFLGDDPEITRLEYRYDPRVCLLDGKYWITWCNGYHGPTIGVGWTEDFVTFHQVENAFLPYNRNGVLFPERIGGNYAMLSRPSDTGHTAFGDIFYSESPDMTYWGRHRHVMSKTEGWQATKIGAGPTPIKTSAGWILLYHGVLTSCNGFVYAFGAALLDLHAPWKVLSRPADYLLSPQTLYECVGDVPNVAFPCAALADGDTGRIAIYYGCADSVTGLAFTTVDRLLDFLNQ